MRINKIYHAALIVLIVMMASFGFGAGPGSYEPDKLRVFIRMDKSTYFADEDVIVQICVKNESERKNYFEVCDTSDRESGNYTSFQPVAYDMMGREAEIVVPYKVQNKNINDIVRNLDKRTVELAPGETFIHAVNLKDIFAFKLNTPYRLQSLVYPSIEEGIMIKSDNELLFKIIEEKRSNKPSEIDAIKRIVMPKEVISLTLTAEMNKDWDNYIKYIDIEKYINAFPEFIQIYERANFDDKSRIEKDFIRHLTRDRDDYLLSYNIIKQEIENNRKIAYVDVETSRFGIRWSHRYRYRYTLEQYKNMWLITDLDATAIKGVKQ